MRDRRTFLGIAAASLLPLKERRQGVPVDRASEAQTTPAQTSAGPSPTSGELARHALTGPFEGFEAVLVERTARPSQPGARPNPPHRHPGFVVGYVIEGQLRFAINNEAERVVSAGSTFFEPIGALHSGNGSASGEPVRFLAFLVVPKGSPITTPA